MDTTTWISKSLIAFRIHGVSPEFIGKLQGLGYQHPNRTTDRNADP